MKQKFEVGDTAYWMDNSQPVGTTVIGVLTTLEDNTFFFMNSPLNSSYPSLNRFWLPRSLEDKSTLMMQESKVFLSAEDLKESLFKNL